VEGKDEVFIGRIRKDLFMRKVCGVGVAEICVRVPRQCSPDSGIVDKDIFVMALLGYRVSFNS